MTYHLPRIEHWLQNKSLNHYYTSNNRQLLSAPFAEFLILQGRALSGDDYLANLVQWFSLFGSIIGISKIAGHLGMNKKTQIISALFFATVPMAILQASSTQTDLVETFCIICLTERLLAWRKTGALFESITFGIALGLSILTKGTAYSVAFPFVIYFGVICVKHFRKQFIGGCLAAVLCLAINFPHFTRNYLGFKNPLGAHSGTVSNFTLKSFVITFFADINSNLALPLHRTYRVNKIFTEKVLDVLKVDDTIFPFGRPEINGIRDLATFNEDTVINILHMILIIITFILIFSNKKRNMYIFLVIGSWCMFAYCIPWQPWITRLQLPLFALSAPVFSHVFEDKDKFRKLFIIALASYAILPLVCNSSRPLLYIPRITSKRTVWNTPRDELVFINRNIPGYTDACAAVVQAKIRNLGIVIGSDSWEYPLWRYIRKNPENKIRITHVKEDVPDDNIDALFILDRQMPAVLSLNEDNINTNNPSVWSRNPQNKAEWRILYTSNKTDY
jgi:hypothetical protein